MTESDLSKCISTLKETSIDNHDGKNIKYLTQSTLGVIDFDDVKNDYIRNLAISRPPSSNDALFKDESTDEYYFVELRQVASTQSKMLN